MVVLGKRLLVKELIKDIKINGLIQKYDDSSDFMFVQVIEIGEGLQDKPEYQNIENLVLVLKRIAKIPFIESYFINEEDILAVMSKDEFEEL